MEQKLVGIKRKIMSILRVNGPSLPIHIARETNLTILFASALLSELVSEKSIKISNLKVGGSPLYFLEGQELKLESFYKHLPGKEKQAFLHLKQKKILQDKKQEPAIRVALRNLKDFALPLTINKQGTQELFWRFYSCDKQETIEKLIPNTKTKKQATIKENREKEKPLLSLDSQPKKQKEKPDFPKKIISLLESGNIEILEEKEAKKREYAAVVRINSELGKLKFLCIAKDKKRITENDLRITTQKSQALKMPALFLYPGQLNKKAMSYLEQYSGLITSKKIQ